MAKPWTVSKGVYTLIEDTKANRELLAKELTDIINKKGTDSIKNIRFGKGKKPYRISTRSIEDVEIGTADSITFKSNKPRPRNRNRWGREQFDEGQQRYTGKVRDNMVDEFVKGSKVKPLGKIEGHHVRMLQMYSPFYEGLSEAEKVELSKFAVEYKFPLGDAKANIALLDEDFHKQIHAFMREKGYQLSTGKVAKGTPDLGNTFKSRKDALKHFFDNVQTPIENELSRIKWDQQAKYNPLSEAEFENQLNWLNSNEYAELKRSGKVKGKVTDLGKRLGGLDDTITIKPHLFRDHISGILKTTGKVLKFGSNVLKEFDSVFSTEEKELIKIDDDVKGLLKNKDFSSIDQLQNSLSINLARVRNPSGKLMKDMINDAKNDTNFTGLGGVQVVREKLIPLYDELEADARQKFELAGYDEQTINNILEPKRNMFLKKIGAIEKSELIKGDDGIYRMTIIK